MPVCYYSVNYEQRANDIVLLFCIQLIFVACLAGMGILSCLICKHKQALYLSLTMQEECMTVTCL